MTTITCPDCPEQIPTTGKHVHRCCGDYVTNYDGAEVPGFYRSEALAWEALNSYVYSLIRHNLLVTQPAQSARLAA
jgi:hypothetical protein